MPPVARTTTLNPIVFKDFTKGISDHPGFDYPAESATRENTYRCIANRAGALTPLPARSIPFSMPVDATDPVDGHFGLVGLYVPPMSVLPTTAADVNYGFTYELHVGNEWLAGGNRHMRWRRYRRFETPGTSHDLLKDFSAADTDTHLIPSGMDFGTTRSKRDDRTLPGEPVVIALWSTGFVNAFLSEFPDDQNTTSNTPYDIFTATAAFILGICCHQGRVIAQRITSNNRGVNSFMFAGENVVWSQNNNVTTADWIPTPANVVLENPSAYAFMISMTANELFAVKMRGGLYISGNLGDDVSMIDATVVSLPMVVGSDISQRAVQTDIGVVYANPTSGIWVWPHGDTSQTLSPQMDPDFWTTDDDPAVRVWGGVHYGLDRCDDWVLVPNNWIYDTTLKSWWRLEDPTVTRIRYFTSLAGHIYGSRSFYTNADPTPISFWRRDVPTSSYSWQSHPIWPSVPDIVNVAQIELVAEGHGDVTVALTAADGEHATHTFTLDDCGFPERFRAPFAIQGRYLQLRVVADSHTSAAAAAIYSVTLNPFTEQPIGAS